MYIEIQSCTGLKKCVKGSAVCLILLTIIFRIFLVACFC